MKHSPLLILIGALLVSCSTTNLPPPNAYEGRWHRDQDGYITSGISADQPTVEGQAPSSNVGNNLVARNPAFSGEIRDPLEDLPEFRTAFTKANQYADMATAKYRGQLGRCHAFWSEKKKYLREKYHMDWKTPAELNPNTSYD